MPSGFVVEIEIELLVVVAAVVVTSCRDEDMRASCPSSMSRLSYCDDLHACNQSDVAYCHV